MKRAQAEKILVLGIDGMDPNLTRKYVEKGVMPNTKAFIERGAQREDLVMLGAHPTITPPMWTTLACGCYPMVHGITCFSRQSPDNLDEMLYNLDSRNCQAEPLWNVFAENNKKTLVFHWPGSSWPPTSDSPNLHVVDGTQPGVVNMGVAQVESELIMVADIKTEAVTFRRKAASDGNIPCIITDLKKEDIFSVNDLMTSGGAGVEAAPIHNIILTKAESGGNLSENPFDIALSPIRPAQNWSQAPEGAKEFTLLLSGGLLRRVGLIVPDENGVYNKVLLYKSKRAERPLAVLENNVMTVDIIDESIRGEQTYTVNRNMRILDLAEDGNHIKLWVSAAMDINNDTVWHPNSLYKRVADAIGYPPPEANLGGSDRQLISDCMHASWEVAANWQAKTLQYLIAEENYDVVFSHFHNVDAQGHMVIQFLKDKGNAKLPHEYYEQFLEDMYTQTDRYLGQFRHYLDEGWSVFIVSDHAQVSSDYFQPFLGSGAGVNIHVMRELGFTYVKQDENGNDLHAIDWEKTKAVAIRCNHIYLNLKGRNKYGIVDEADRYELEEEIITALYGYKHPESHKRIVALALRRKDAVLLGLGGDYPQCGDIIYFMSEGYNNDHGDCLSTTFGFCDTTVSPIFIAAGKGLKQGYTTARYIRQVDFAPTLAYLGGVRMPRECEGAPVYQIFDED